MLQKNISLISYSQIPLVNVLICTFLNMRICYLHNIREEHSAIWL